MAVEQGKHSHFWDVLLLIFSLQITSPISSLFDMTDDCERFILRFFKPMASSAMHVYHSALVWCPTSSLTRGIYRSQLAVEAQLVNGLDPTWDDCIRTIQVHRGVYQVLLSHKGTLIAALRRHSLDILDAIMGACLACYHDRDGSPLSVTFSPDNSLLASGFRYGTVGIIDVQTGDLIQTFQGHSGMVVSVEFSPCGTMIASGSEDKTIRIWNMSSGHCVCCLEGHSGGVWAVCWSAKGDQVISGSQDNAVRVWDVSTRTCSKIIHGHAEAVMCVASSGDLVASGYRSGVVKICDLRSGNVLQTIWSGGYKMRFPAIKTVQFSSHGDKIMYTNWNEAYIWDLDRKKRVSQIAHYGDNGTFSPDGAYFAFVHVEFVNIWKTESGNSDSKAVHKFSGRVYNISFALDGKLLACRSLFEAGVWDTTSGECLFTFDSRDSTGFSPNFALVACCPNQPSSGDTWTVWNVRTRRLVKKIKCHAHLVALSSDGTRMACVSYSRVLIWSLVTGERLAQLELDDAPQYPVSKIAFDIDESDILIASKDDLTKSWRISPANLPDYRSSKNKSSTLPMVCVPMHEEWSIKDISTPSQYCRYKEGAEWIVDQDGVRMFWVPPDRRGSAIDIHGKKVAVGTDSGRVYIVDFSGTLSSRGAVLV
jgi:WD40 repeat protein